MATPGSCVPSVSYNVEKILGISEGQDNLKTYKVQWAPTWVSEVQLRGCEQLVKEFLTRQKRLIERLQNYHDKDKQTEEEVVSSAENEIGGDTSEENNETSYDQNQKDITEPDHFDEVCRAIKIEDEDDDDGGGTTSQLDTGDEQSSTPMLKTRIRNDEWKNDDSLKEDLEKYVAERLRLEDVKCLVARDYPQYAWSLPTLKRRLSLFNIRMIDNSVGPQQIGEAVFNEILNAGGDRGFRAITAKLRTEHNLKVKERDVLQALHEIDPEGVERRGNVGKNKEEAIEEEFVSLDQEFGNSAPTMINLQEIANIANNGTMANNFVSREPPPVNNGRQNLDSDIRMMLDNEVLKKIDLPVDKSNKSTHKQSIVDDIDLIRARNRASSFIQKNLNKINKLNTPSSSVVKNEHSTNLTPCKKSDDDPSSSSSSTYPSNISHDTSGDTPGPSNISYYNSDGALVIPVTDHDVYRHTNSDSGLPGPASDYETFKRWEKFMQENEEMVYSLMRRKCEKLVYNSCKNILSSVMDDNLQQHFNMKGRRRGTTQAKAPLSETFVWRILTTVVGDYHGVIEREIFDETGKYLKEAGRRHQGRMRREARRKAQQVCFNSNKPILIECTLDDEERGKGEGLNSETMCRDDDDNPPVKKHKVNISSDDDGGVDTDQDHDSDSHSVHTIVS